MNNQKIDSFQGEYRWLSNFWPAEVIFEGLTYPSVENAYQAAKYPQPQRHMFRLCTPGKAKRLGQKAKLPENWEEDKLKIMTELVKDKFTSNKLLRLSLLHTGASELVEGNTWGDVFWGQVGGYGLNHLGKILMQVRSEL